jgi:Putative transposase
MLPVLPGGGDASRGAEEGEKLPGFSCQNVLQTCAMAPTRQRVDKDTFQQIFRDHWGTFQQCHPRYQDRHGQAVIDKMLGCGTPEAGYVVVLETAGRSGHWNPHLHILMTSSGVTPQQQWREVDYFPFTVLHKKWQYHLFTMLKQRVGTHALKAKIDALWRKYAQGLVAYLGTQK